MILYILLCGFPPFNGPNDPLIMEKVFHDILYFKVKIGKYNFEGEEWDVVSDDAKNFISRML